MREDFVKSHVNCVLTLWGKEWAWEHSGGQYEEMLEIICYF